MPDVQLSNPRLEGILPESAYLGRPYNSHIMAYHEEKNGSFSLKIRRLMIGEKKQRKRTYHTELAAQSSVHEPGRDGRANSRIVIMTRGSGSASMQYSGQFALPRLINEYLKSQHLFPQLILRLSERHLSMGPVSRLPV
jgi:hypothetical protein